MRRLDLHRRNVKLARARWGLNPGHVALEILKMYSNQFRFSLSMGDLLFLDQNWYVTHVGLIRLSRRRRCCGIEVHPVAELCDASQRRYAFSATVYTTRDSIGFVGYGDADPSNVSALFMAPKCASPRHAPSIALCARPMESASARSRKSVPSPGRFFGQSRRRFHRNLSMGIQRLAVLR